MDRIYQCISLQCFRPHRPMTFKMPFLWLHSRHFGINIAGDLLSVPGYQSQCSLGIRFKLALFSKSIPRVSVMNTFTNILQSWKYFIRKQLSPSSGHCHLICTRILICIACFVLLSLPNQFTLQYKRMHLVNIINL